MKHNSKPVVRRGRTEVINGFKILFMTQVSVCRVMAKSYYAGESVESNYLEAESNYIMQVA